MLGGPQIPATLVVGGSIVENQSIKKELQKRLASSGALFSLYFCVCAGDTTAQNPSFFSYAHFAHSS